MEYQKNFLRNMIDMFPDIYQSWSDKEYSNFQNIAKQSSDGFREVENTIYNYYDDLFQSQFSGVTSLFYNAMLVMTYSFYEEFINKIANDKEKGFECSSQDSYKKITCLMDSKNKKFSQKCLNDIKYINKYIRILRNDICHNNAGTLKHKKEIKELCNRQKDVIIDQDIILITGKDFILDVLNKEFLILSELVNKLEY